MSKKSPFRLFVNQFSAGHTKTWAVEVKGRRNWKLGRRVFVRVPVTSVFSVTKYKRKIQPFAWFTGVGVVERVGDCLVIR